MIEAPRDEPTCDSNSSEDESDTERCNAVLQSDTEWCNAASQKDVAESVVKTTIADTATTKNKRVSDESAVSATKDVSSTEVDTLKIKGAGSTVQGGYKVVHRGSDVQVLASFLFYVSYLLLVKKSRLSLPILGEEHTIMDAINNNNVIIVCGETGCGKTTQVPQFLYEYGYTNEGRVICITEPRRVAAVTLSHRVAHELSLTSR